MVIIGLLKAPSVPMKRRKKNGTKKEKKKGKSKEKKKGKKKEKKKEKKSTGSLFLLSIRNLVLIILGHKKYIQHCHLFRRKMRGRATPRRELRRVSRKRWREPLQWSM